MDISWNYTLPVRILIHVSPQAEQLWIDFQLHMNNKSKASQIVVQLSYPLLNLTHGNIFLHRSPKKACLLEYKSLEYQKYAKLRDFSKKRKEHDFTQTSSCFVEKKIGSNS